MIQVSALRVSYFENRGNYFENRGNYFENRGAGVTRGMGVVRLR